MAIEVDSQSPFRSFSGGATLVNASLNWASIVGIVLAVGGAGLYFLRSFKPALARDYDVFFAAIGLLCGGILFFQGWRLDPILQFGQFLLAGTTVFFAYESVRLRGVATDQARRSSYFDDEPSSAQMPGGGPGLRDGWDESYEQFEDSPRLTRRFSGSDEPGAQASQDDFYRPRRASRAAIPEQAASRNIRSRSTPQGSWKDEEDVPSRMARFSSRDEDADSSPSFGKRRNLRQEQRRGTRPVANQETVRKGRNMEEQAKRPSNRGAYSSSGRPGVPQGSPIGDKAEDAAFSPSRATSARAKEIDRAPSEGRSRFSSKTQSRRSKLSDTRRRDNSSRFDD